MKLLGCIDVGRQMKGQVNAESEWIAIGRVVNHIWNKEDQFQR